MSDFYFDPNEKVTDSLGEIWKHILIISKGQCEVTDELLMNTRDERLRLILGGLQMLQEDLDDYKQDFVAKIEAEHKVKLLEQKNEELSQFTYIASHDLQEPLNTIASFSTLLRNNYSNQLDEEGQMYLKYIEESSARMHRLIHDLLTYSRVGDERKYEQVDTNKIMGDIILDYQHKIVAYNTDVKWKPLPKVSGVPVQIQQLFTNIFSNALKFSSRQEQPTIEITSKIQGQKVLFCIADNGIGIEKDHQEKIFKIFHRLHTRKDYQGTGIGLSLCKKIIELHKGEIWLESKINQGSKFFFTLPK